MSLNEKSVAYGAQKSSIREISAYAGERKAQIGAENVFDFSLGNPSIPAPDAVRASIEKSLTLPATQLHGYTPASGLPAAREAVAASLCRRFGVRCNGRGTALTGAKNKFNKGETLQWLNRSHGSNSPRGQIFLRASCLIGRSVIGRSSCMG